MGDVVHGLFGDTFDVIFYVVFDVKVGIIN